MNAGQIRKLRERRGWTQQDLAMRMHTAMSTVYMWESGRTKPRGPALVLLKLIDAGVDVDGILYADTNR